MEPIADEAKAAKSLAAALVNGEPDPGPMVPKATTERDGRRGGVSPL